MVVVDVIVETIVVLVTGGKKYSGGLFTVSLLGVVFHVMRMATPPPHHPIVVHAFLYFFLRVRFTQKTCVVGWRRRLLCSTSSVRLLLFFPFLLFCFLFAGAGVFVFVFFIVLGGIFFSPSSLCRLLHPTQASLL